MYTICSPRALKDSFVALDRAGKTPTCTVSGAASGAMSKSEGRYKEESTHQCGSDWLAVVLSDSDPTIIVKEFNLAFDTKERNRKALRGETVQPVSAATAATISFPSLMAGARTKHNSDPQRDGDDDESCPFWHYRYRFNKRGRCVIETNDQAEAFWVRHFGEPAPISGEKKEEMASCPPIISIGEKGSLKKTAESQKRLQREIVVFYRGGGAACAEPSPQEGRPLTNRHLEEKKYNNNNSSAENTSDVSSPAASYDLPSSAFGAVDLNCYHIGYPIDMGDIEDISVAKVGVVGIGEEGDEEGGGRKARDGGDERGDNKRKGGMITLINCPLHNRNFDVCTGDLIRMDYSNAFASCLLGGGEEDGDQEALFKVTSGKWKGGVVQRDACRQRIHKVEIRRGEGCKLSSSDLSQQKDKRIEGRIVIYDSFFPRNSAVGTNDVDQTSSARLAPTFASDKYNVYGDTSITAKR